MDRLIQNEEAMAAARLNEDASEHVPMAALLAMAMTGFTAILTETLPAGLLPAMAADLHVTPSLAGQSVTAYAAGSLIAAIPLTKGTEGFERRAVLLAAVLGFLIFNTVTALAPSFSVLLAARFMAGVAAGLAWGMLAGFARRLVPHHLAGRALAIAMVGTPIALSFGVPAGTLLGSQAGWRGAFLAMSATTVALIAWVLVAIPRTPGQPAHQRLTIGSVLGRPGIRPIMLTVFTWMTAHNILYTYVAPFARLSGLEGRVDLLLLAFGIAALGGIWHTGGRVDHMLRGLVLTSLALFIAASAAMLLAPQIAWIVIVAVLVWGFSFGGAATQLQTAAADAAGDGVDIASAINTTVWNGAIAAGGIVGGILLQTSGPAILPGSAILFAGVALTIAVASHAYASAPAPVPPLVPDPSSPTSRGRPKRMRIFTTKDHVMTTSIFKGALSAFSLAVLPALALPASVSAETVREEFPTLSGFTPGFETVSGVRLHYLKGGSGPLVLLVHGFGQSWYEWHQLMPLLAKDHTVVAVDLPGLGQSGTAPSYAGQDVAPLLHGLAKHFSPNAAFDLVAHDIGIWNTYPMLAEHGADVRRVVYMEAPIPDDSIYTYPAFTPTGESLVWHFSFFAAGDNLAQTLITGKERFFFGHFIKVHATNTAAFTPELLDLYAKSYAKPATLNAAFGYYRALNETARRNRPLGRTKLTMPILAIGGGGNGGFGDKEAEQIRQYATNVTGKSLPGCGHWVPEECPALLNPLVVDFLRK